ncbi:putative VanZ domain protein [Phyllosticta citriasiana]|uniref:VanZ domain protein n=1 Tax=Phyllosticta citriasiana TaxID=595635 RepID=A0ABR1KUP0_9PEZI
MRIRKVPAGAFAAFCLLAAAGGFGRQQIPSYKQSDKALHFITFFLITLCFYWIIETNRRRVLHLTLFVCPLLLGVGSEVVQGLLPNDRQFDPWDILANAVGSLSAIALCSWYHKRMLERRRQAKLYHAVPGEDNDEVDLELGEGTSGSRHGQESGVIREGGEGGMSVEEELDNWDENAEDWDADEADGGGGGASTAGDAPNNNNKSKGEAAEAAATAAAAGGHNHSDSGAQATKKRDD